MGEPSELSLREIHAYFLRNNFKVTNTQLVKHFKRFLTGASISKFVFVWRLSHPPEINVSR